MRKTVYVILVLCCFIIKTYSINRPYYHLNNFLLKKDFQPLLYPYTMTKRFIMGRNHSRNISFQWRKNQEI